MLYWSSKYSSNSYPDKLKTENMRLTLNSKSELQSSVRNFATKPPKKSGKDTDGWQSYGRSFNVTIIGIRKYFL